MLCGTVSPTVTQLPSLKKHSLSETLGPLVQQELGTTARAIRRVLRTCGPNSRFKSGKMGAGKRLRIDQNISVFEDLSDAIDNKDSHSIATR